MKIIDILFKKHYLFKDGYGKNPVPFKWWISWKIALWHLKKWLEYEGMPKGITDIYEILKWLRKTAK